MPDHNYNVKVLVDVQGKKVMDDLAKGAGSSPSTGGSTGTPTGTGDKNVGSTLQSLIGSITPLTAVIGVGVGMIALALSNSKVLTKIMGTVGKMLGFMLDIVLLPLMPLIMGLMRLMWQFIIAFKGWDKKLQEKGFLGIALDITPIGPAYELAKWLLPFLFKENKGSAIGAVSINIGGILDPAIEWFKGLGNVWNIVVNFVEGSFQWLKDLIKQLWDLLHPEKPGIPGVPSGVEPAPSVGTAGSWSWDRSVAGVIKQPQSPGGSANTFNFYGFAENELLRKIREILDQSARSSTVMW